MYIDYYNHNHNIIPSPAWSLVLNRGGFSKWRFCACAQLVTPRYRASVIGFYSLQETLERTCATRESLCWWKKWIGFNSRLSFMRLLMFLLVKTPGKNRRHSKNKIRQRPCMFVDYLNSLNKSATFLIAFSYLLFCYQKYLQYKKDTHKAFLKKK